MSNWNDEGIILNLNKQGEKGMVLSVLTQNYGRHLGWYNVRSKKLNFLQPGDLVKLIWKARVSDQLGTYYIELMESTVGKILENELKLSILSSYCSLLNFFLPEREICNRLYQVSNNYLNELKNNSDEINVVIKKYLIWEINILKELGFYFDLKKCAVSGMTSNLKFVSPKTGNAVSEKYAGKFEKKLFILPKFLGGIKFLNDNEFDDILRGFELNQYFFKKFVSNIDYKHIKMPFLARDNLLEKFKLKFTNGRK
tara:strand:+ start:791 stop:1555 length:765 start_codon:yes stop_codon:yes gene_type:complete